MARLSFRELMKQDAHDPIWVVNQLSGPNKGPLLLNMMDATNTTINIRVDATFVPIDLCEKAEREAILRSQDFRKAVDKGILRIINQEEAEKLLGTDEAEAELGRLRSGRQHAQAMQHDNYGDPATNDDQVSESVKVILNIGGGEAQIASKLRLLDHQMRDADYMYIAKRAKAENQSALIKFAEDGLKLTVEGA